MNNLTSLSGGSTDYMTYDSNGNILAASGKTYTYNAANRMLTSNDELITTNYLINFMGQRTKKSNSSSTTWFIYDENDNVIAEYDVAGNLTNEYVYLDSRPVALLRASNLYYIYTDHLNTPRAITDTANNLQWTWENKEAFGNNLPTEVVTGFKFNFRLPGQYFDSETNLNYNIHRDYNPVWGRYMSSDPLGLMAGINTYGYVDGDGLGAIDRLGLLAQFIFVKDSLFSYDHIALRINSNIYSLGPTAFPIGGLYSKADVRIQSINDFNKSYIKNKNLQLNVLTLDLSTAQENSVILYFLRLNQRDDLYYSINGNQCATIANVALSQVEINNKNFNNKLLKRPINLYDSIKQNTKVIKNETYTPSTYK